MALIKGIRVTLFNKVQTGVDTMNAPVYSEIPETVENVLVKPADSTDVISDIQLYGKQVAYELCIPKGDTHTWENRRVDFFGKAYQTVGFVKEYIEDLLPLDWNKQIKVVRYG